MMKISTLHNISRLKRGIILALLVLAGIVSIKAQEQKLQNRPYIDLRKFHYGFMIGAHQQNFHLKNNGFIDPETGKQWLACNNRMDPGFSVGILGEWRLNTYLGFRILPTMHFGSKHVVFREQASNERVFQDIKSTYVSFPFDIKFSAPRHNNYRPYFISGLNFMYDLTTKSDDYLKLKPFNTFFEIGFGCDYYLPFFKLIPELKFCIGLNNVLDKDRSDLNDNTKKVFTQSIDDAQTYMIVLTFYFE